LLATPRPNVSLGSLRQKSLPRGFEIGAGFVESWRRFRPDVRLGVSPDRNRNAVPTGLRHAGRRCGSRSYREHVIIVDVWGIGRSAAGESGHPSSNCGIEGVGKPSYSLGSKIGAESLRGGTQGPPEAGVGGEYALLIGRSRPSISMSILVV